MSERKVTIYIDGAKFTAPVSTVQRVVDSIETAHYKYRGAALGYEFEDQPKLPLAGSK